MSEYKKIAIFGGTFNPVHFGHLLVAEQVFNYFDIGHIIFMPAGIPPHKEDKEIVASEHRLNMVKLAIKDNGHFSCSDYELKKNEKSYTAETLRYFEKEDIAEEIFFIIGADSLLDIFNWRQPEYLLTNSYFIVARRPGYDFDEQTLDEKYKPYRERIILMDTVLVDFSSTRIRNWVKKGYSIKYQTSRPVIEYINKYQLYRGG